ncbi:helix-turn-helix domain-containing protein, partial [candidate division TA06 bacterium]|nr:helix-turn-helix domain-containing protein [candidate division TA06 bacterium]
MIEQGVKVTEIARELNRSREWVYKWEARWRTG